MPREPGSCCTYWALSLIHISRNYPRLLEKLNIQCKVFGIPPLRRKAHFCAISPTSGTATEVTAFSIITDYQKGIKYPIADFEITPCLLYTSRCV